jgi:hypothetical protein
METEKLEECLGGHKPHRGKDGSLFPSTTRAFLEGLPSHSLCSKAISDSATFHSYNINRADQRGIETLHCAFTGTRDEA